MKMIMEYQISFDFNNFKKDDYYFDLGGYEFIVNNKEIPFDFEACGYNVKTDGKRVYLNYESGEGLAFDEYDVDSCFDGVYESLGLTRADITAEFLASADKISEFFIDMLKNGNSDSENLKNFTIDYIKFTDYNTEKEFKVDDKVLKDFNRNLEKENSLL